MLNEPKTFGITAEADPELWALLQPPTENPFTLESAAELTENAAPQGWAAIEADDELAAPLDLDLCEEDLSLLDDIWSKIRRLQFDAEGLRRFVDTERSEREGQVEALEDHIDRELSMLRQDLERLESETDRRIDALELELERTKDNIATLEDRLDEHSIVPFNQRPHRLVEFLRITAVLALGIGAVAFIGAGLSGTPQQKDDLALSGAILATAGVFAATVGYNLD